MTLIQILELFQVPVAGSSQINLPVVANWFVSPEGSNGHQTQIISCAVSLLLCIIIDDDLDSDISSSQAALPCVSQLLSATSTFFHSQNTGKWSNALSTFVMSFCRGALKREVTSRIKLLRSRPKIEKSTKIVCKNFDATPILELLVPHIKNMFASGKTNLMMSSLARECIFEIAASGRSSYNDFVWLSDAHISLTHFYKQLYIRPSL